MKSESDVLEPENPEMEGLLHNPELEGLLQAEQQGLLNQQNGKQPLITEKISVTIKPSQPVSSRQSTSTAVDDEVDVVSMVIGDYGRWQLMMTFLLSLFSFPCTFHIYMPTFTLRTPQHWCERPSYLTDVPVEDWIQYSQPDGPCSIRQLPANITSQSIIDKTALVLDNITKCTAWEFNKTEMGETIISEWNLVCDREMYTTLADVLFLVGVGIGGVLGGLVSDKFGRKRTLMAMALVQSILALLALLVRSYLQYVIVRLIMGLVSVSVVYAAFVLAVEVVGGKWMTIAGVCNFFPLPLSYIIVSLVSLALPDWRDLQLSLSLPGWLLLVLWFVLPESPRWLLTMGKTQEAKKILEAAAAFNKRPLPADLDKLLLVHKSDQPPETSSITVLFKGQLLKRSVCLFIAWFGMTIGYYGMLLNIGNFGLGNLHMSSIILAAVEIPAIAISIPILLKLGRKKPIFSSFALCAAACIATVLLNLSFESDIVMISSLMIGKFAISTTNMMLPIFTAELYPTYVRNLGVGASQLSSGIALIFVPYLWYLSSIAKQLPLSTIALICFAGGLVVLLLPETSRRCQESAHPIDKIENTVTISGTLTADDDRGHH